MGSIFKLFVFIIVPLLLLPLPLIYPSSIGKCAYILIVIAIFWMTETFHLSVTSLLPIVLLPLMGVVSSQRVTMHYLTNSTVLILGGLFVARAIEFRNLHKRIALFVLLKIGTNPVTLILGFMLPTWMMSMWITNIAATSMVYSIVDAVITDLQTNEHGSPRLREESGLKEMRMTNVEILESGSDEDSPLIKRSKFKNIASRKESNFGHSFATGASLCVAYASTCGGIGTLTGTAPNLIFYGLITSRYGEASGINFGSYMGYAIPISFLCMIVTWFWICCLFIGPRKIYSPKLCNDDRRQIRTFLRREYSKLGPLSFAEKSCIVWLMTLIGLWVTRDPGYSLWGSLFTFKQADGTVISYATDTQPVILISIILMTWPSENPFVRNYWKSDIKYEPLLPWNDMQSKLPWSIVFMIGGGMALADACEVSGLSEFIGIQLTVMRSMPPYLMMFIMISVISCVTEITSNTAIATVVLPLILSLAECSGINPLLLSLPAIISTSLAFCLPVSTPPNAFVFAKGKVALIDMVRCGVLLNITAVFVVFLCTITYGKPMFSLDTFPSWANKCMTVAYNQSS